MHRAVPERLQIFGVPYDEAVTSSDHSHPWIDGPEASISLAVVNDFTDLTMLGNQS
jgi:hypothetical protein